jgi:hypothetical protein
MTSRSQEKYSLLRTTLAQRGQITARAEFSINQMCPGHDLCFNPSKPLEELLLTCFTTESNSTKFTKSRLTRVQLASAGAPGYRGRRPIHNSESFDPFKCHTCQNSHYIYTLLT